MSRFVARNNLIALFVITAGFMIYPTLVTAQSPSKLLYPIDVAVGGDGTIYIADRDLPGIWKFKDGNLSVYFQAEKKFRTPLNAIRCIAVDKDGSVIAGDSATTNVYKVTADNKAIPLSTKRIGIPMGVAVSADGDIYCTDLETFRIYKLAKPADAAVEPQLVGEIRAPRGIAISGSGEPWVVSGVANPVRKIVGDKVEVVVKDRPLQYPSAIAFRENGEVVVCDSYAKSLSSVAADGTLKAIVSGAPFDHPVGLKAVGNDLYVADSRANAIFKITADNKVETVISGK